MRALTLLDVRSLPKREDPKQFRYGTLTALMLSSQTEDPVTADVCSSHARSIAILPRIAHPPFLFP